MEAALATEPEALEKIIPILLQLRPQYSADSLKTQIQKQQRNGYQIAYVTYQGEVLSVAGFVISEKLAWGKHLYVDDLVTSEKLRGTGAGTYLLDWLKTYAKSQRCTQIHLDSGVQRFDAHRFYLREGFHIASHHFSITQLTD